MMETGYITIEHLIITINDGVLGLPCLAGEIGDRSPGVVYVEVVEGKLHNADYGYAYGVEPGDDVKGWGELDGIGANLVNEGGKYVTVPQCVMDRLRSNHGLKG